MALDTNIPLQVKVPQAPDLLQQYGRVAQLQALLNQQKLLPEQLKTAQLENQGRQLQNQQLQTAIGGQQAQDEAWKSAVSIDENGAPKIDQNAITQGLSAKGYGHLVPGVLKSFTEMDEAAGKVREQKSKLSGEELDYAGTVGAAAKAAKYDPDILKIGLSHAAAIYGPNSPSAQALAALQQDPSKAQLIADHLIAQSPKQAQLANETKTADARATTADIAKQKLPGELTNQGLTTTELTQKTTGNVPITPVEQARLDAENARLDREKKAAEETARHNLIDERQASGRLSVEQERLKLQREQAGFDMGGGISPTATMAAQGKIAPATLRGILRRSPGLLNQIKQVDPDFDEGNIENRYNTLKEFTSTSNGKAGGQAIALNTMIHHADLYLEAADALKNGTFTPGNAAYNHVAALFGSAPPQNAALVARFLAGETGKVATGGVPAEGEINGILKSLGTASSPQQIEDAGKKLIQLAGGRAMPLIERAKQAKIDKIVQVIGPDAQEILKRRGFDPQTMKPVAGGPGGLTATRTLNNRGIAIDPKTNQWVYVDDGQPAK